MILHIISKIAWDLALQGGEYYGDTLDSQGFIHCSTAEQIIEVANYTYKGQSDLLLLIIDESKVLPVVKYEDAGDGEFLSLIHI